MTEYHVHHTATSAKEAERQKLKDDMDSFLSSGGKVKHLEAFIRNDKPLSRGIVISPDKGIQNCEHCKKPFSFKKSERTRSYCSQACYKAAAKKGGFC